MNRFHRWLCGSGLWRKAIENKLVPWALDRLTLGAELLEIGPGPGLATGCLLSRADHLTAVEIESQLAASLGRRMPAGEVRVVRGDATYLPFRDESFSAAVCFTMLHHLPSRAAQDRLIGEVFRVLQPGGVLAGTDSLWSRSMQLIHGGDTLVTVNPGEFGRRLESAGFSGLGVEIEKRVFRFAGRRQ
jgi:ubiquinone/menaquinone biosynthesis C-methylase UbiE